MFKPAQKSNQNVQKKLVEFTLHLQDRHGRRRELKGLVEEGTTRNDAVEKLVREHGGKCEIEEGKGELAGFRWIKRIEFKDGFKIEEWGQFATINGEFEIGKIKKPLMSMLFSTFFGKESATAFWENGDTKRITQRDNAVLFREDYGVTNELPAANAILNLDNLDKLNFRGGGCGGAITAGEIELVKLAARLDIKREDYLINFGTGTIKKKEAGNSEMGVDINSLVAPKRTSLFDSGMPASMPAMSYVNHYLKDNLADNFVDRMRRIRHIQEVQQDDLLVQDIGQGALLSSIAFYVMNQGHQQNIIEAAPNLFFSEYAKENAGEKQGQSKEEKESGETEKGKTVEIKDNEEEISKKKKERKMTNEENEDDKISSIIEKLKADEKKADEKRADEEADKQKDKNTGRTNERDEGSAGATDQNNKEDSDKTVANQTKIAPKKHKSVKQEKTKEKESKKEKMKKQDRKKDEGKKENIKKPKKEVKSRKTEKTIDKKAKSDRSRFRNEKKTAKKQGTRSGESKKGRDKRAMKKQTKKQEQRQEQAKKQKQVQVKKAKIKKIKLKKIKIKNTIRKPKIRHSNPHMKKGAQMAHELFLRALKKAQSKKKIATAIARGK